MSRLFFYLLFTSLGILCGCCPSRNISDATGDAPGPRNVSGPDLRKPVLNRIKQNATIISATVGPVVIVDTLRYHIELTLLAVTAMEDIDSFAEAGQKITVAPAYIFDSGGWIDLNNPVNRRLFTLRSLAPGTVVKGKVSLSNEGSWMLIDSLD